MDELISRRDTISAMEGTNWYHINSDGQLVHGANSKEGEPLYKAEDVYKVLNTMPSVQPEKRTENTQKTHACDLISRQAAIEALDEQIEQCNKALSSFDISLKDEFAIKVERASLKAYREQLENLPPVQPKIIHCKDCKHWNLQVGNVKGDGLGSCDFHNVNFVTGEGFCYWAARRGNEDGTD